MNRKVIGIACVVLAMAGQPAMGASAQAKNITVKPLSATYETVNVLKTTLEMKLDGQKATKEKVKGALKIMFAYNTPKNMAEMGMSGALISVLVGNNSPAEQLTGIGIYDTGTEAYMLMDAKKDVCTKMPAGTAGTIMGDNPIQGLGLSEMTGSFEKLSQEGKLTGKRVGNEKVNGIATTHYTLDAAALKAFIDEIEKSSADGPRNKAQFNKGDLWVATDGSYLVQFKVQGAGEMKSLGGFTGNVGITFGVSDINNEAYEVVPPEMCLG